MPYKLSENGLCVHKLNEDGTLGEKLKCYRTHKDALAYLQALEANVEDAHKSVDESLNAAYEEVATAFNETLGYNASTPYNANAGYMCDAKADYVVAEFGNTYYKIPYTKEDGKIAFSSREMWTVVAPLS